MKRDRESQDESSLVDAVAQEASNLQRLLNFTTEEVRGKLRTEDDPYGLVILVALFSRATTTLQALTLLVQNGFGQQAMMLNRAVFELVVDAYWVAENHALAEERFVQHARFHHHLKNQLAKSYPEIVEEVPTADKKGLDLDELLRLEKLYSKHGVGSWTGLNLYQRVEAITERFTESDKRQLRIFRDVVHRLNNEELHPTSQSISRVARRLPTGDGEILQFRIAPEPELCSIAIRSAWWMYLQLLHLVIATFNIPLADTLQELSDSVPWPADPGSPPGSPA